MADGSPRDSLRVRAVARTLVVDGLFPYLVYVLARRYTGVSEVTALGLSAVPPLISGAVGLAQRRRVDFIGGVVIVGIVVSLVAVFAGGSPQLILIRESFVTGALGLLALSSFAWRRPLMFYIGRQMSAGDDPVALQRFDDLWKIAGGRRTFRVMTLVWALGWLGEFAGRVLMVLTLMPAQVLAIAPVVFNAITVALIAWTLTYARRRRSASRASSAGSSIP